MKYYVILTKGNTEQRVKAFDDREEAVQFGEDFFSKLNPGDGTVTVEGIEAGNPQRRIVTGWHF